MPPAVTGLSPGCLDVEVPRKQVWVVWSGPPLPTRLEPGPTSTLGADSGVDNRRLSHWRSGRVQVVPQDGTGYPMCRVSDPGPYRNGTRPSQSPFRAPSAVQEPTGVQK